MRFSLSRLAAAITVCCIGFAVLAINDPRRVATEVALQFLILAPCLLRSDWGRSYFRLTGLGWALTSGAGGPHVASRLLDLLPLFGVKPIVTVCWVLFAVAAVALFQWVKSAAVERLKVMIGIACLFTIWLLLAWHSDYMIRVYHSNCLLLFSLVVCGVSEAQVWVRELEESHARQP